MDEALRSAHHDARVLSSHLKRYLGKGNETLSESAARTATTFVLAQANAHGDLDTEKALRLSRVAPPPATARSTTQDTSGDAMDVEGDVNTDAAAVSGIGGETLPSSPGEQIDSMRAASSRTMTGFSNAENHNVAAANRTPTGGGHEPAIDNGSIVDRRRLITILAAEERISAMARHLGSADPMIHLRSLLLPEQASSDNWLSRSAKGVPGGHPRGMSSSSMKSSAGDEGLESAAATAMHRSETVTDEFPPLGGDSHPGIGQGKPAQRKQRRSRSAEDNLVSSSKSGPWDDCVTDESNHGRKKRSREGEELVGPASLLDDLPHSGLARSSSLATNERHEMMAPEAGVTGSSSYCSLPMLKASRLSWYEQQMGWGLPGTALLSPGHPSVLPYHVSVGTCLCRPLLYSTVSFSPQHACQ